MATKTPKRKMGRPPLPASKKRLPSVGFRPTPEIRKKLAKAADSSDRSLSQEIESRLEASFLSETLEYEEFGGLPLYWLMRAVAASGKLALERMGGDFNDLNARTEVLVMMSETLRIFTKQAATEPTRGFGKSKSAKEFLALMETMLSDKAATNQTQKKTAKKTAKKTGK